jgi:hypothetical protein
MPNYDAMWQSTFSQITTFGTYPTPLKLQALS